LVNRSRCGQGRNPEILVTMHEWSEVERDLFPPGDEAKVAAVEEVLRARVRAHATATREALPTQMDARLRPP
jgi:hypothetical protein